jgi:hypothetical protein
MAIVSISIVDRIILVGINQEECEQIRDDSVEKVAVDVDDTLPLWLNESSPVSVVHDVFGHNNMCSNNGVFLLFLHRNRVRIRD